MNTNGNDIVRLFDELKRIGWWDRIFHWRRVRTLLVDAAAELGQLLTRYELQREKLIEAEKQNIELVKEEELRKQQHDTALATLDKVQQRIEEEREAEKEERHRAEIDRLEKLRLSWSRHEQSVNQTIKEICRRHHVEYVEKVPFKGEPDNTLIICGEFVVFDAKSPGGDSLHHFNAYLLDQAERARKYARQENVKSDIYFVVPSNTLDVLQRFVFPMDDYNVYIVSIDALEPLVIHLRKLEDYEFAEQLSPEERENIARIVGQFTHLSKRRLQVDSFFARQFLELIYKCETLPPDILEKAEEFEKMGKLNPPVEKRQKAIATAELESEINKIGQEAAIRGITADDERISNVLSDI